MAEFIFDAALILLAFACMGFFADSKLGIKLLGGDDEEV